MNRLSRYIVMALCLCALVPTLLPTALVAQGVRGNQNQQAEGDESIIDLGPLLDTLRDEETQTTASPVERAVTVPEYARSGATSGARQTVEDSILLPLKSADADGRRILRLSGERRTAVLTVDVITPEAVDDLTLFYRNSINVLPDRSQLQIRVNGTDVPPVTPTAFESFESIELPPELLVVGTNRIEITAKHHHRIFCGPEATFQIWSEIDLAQSGVRLSRADLPAGPERFAMALSAQLAQRGELPVRIAHADSERVIRQLAKRLAGATGLHAFEIKPESPYAVADPLPSIARITVIEGLPEPVRVAQGADGAVVLVLVVDPSSSEDLPDLDFVLPPAAPAEDIGQLEPGVTTSFADLKFTETNAYNHYSENRLLFRLPDDWLMLSSAQALIELTYSFAPGLPADSLILVKVNDTTVRLLPLETGGGEVLAPLDIGFPANLLNPGPNELNFVSIVPGDPADMSCPASEQPLATILEDSTLTVEATPKMALVGLRSALTSMGADDVRFIGTASDGSQGDEQALALASALRPITGRRPGQSGSLSVVSDQALDEVPIAGLHLSRRDLERVLLAPTPATEPQEERSMFRILPDRALSEGIRRVSASLSNLAKPGEGSLADWIDGRHGQAVLLLPDADAPNDLWLITAADSDPVQVADAVARARTSPYGPKGRISVLTEEGAWQSWQDASAPPVLLEPLTLRNFRAVSGTYASWSPLYFVAILFAFTIMSVMAALTFVVTTRGKRKR